MKLIKKIQSLPEKKRKTIFWVILVLISVILLFFYIRSIQNNLRGNQNMNLENLFKIEGIEDRINKSKDLIFKEFNKIIN